MQTIYNFLRGFLELRITGRFPERFLNICSAAGVAFWNLERSGDEVFLVRVKFTDFERVKALAEKAGCGVELLARRGAPFFFFRFKTRYIFIGGLLLCVFSVYSLSVRVWEFEVTGNETVSSDVILKKLEQCGVKPGVRAKIIDPDRLEDLVLLEIKELRWLTVNVTGSRALVEVRERVPRPPVVDEKQPCNIVALKSGIIESINVLEGSAHVTAGDTVTAGQLLVSGIVDNISGARIVHAMADITANTWYSLEAKMLVDVPFKTPTGVSASKYSLVAAGGRINFYLNGSFSLDVYDKIIERSRFSLPGGFFLPITLEKQTALEYTVTDGQLDGIDSERALERQLIERLSALAPDAEIISARFEYNVEDGARAVKLNAQCLEKIAKTANIPISAEIAESLKLAASAAG